MARKPSNLIYCVDENPPPGEVLILGLQHVFIIAIAFIFPVIIVREIGGTPEQAAGMLRMSMIAGAVGVVIQALKKGPVGSGYLCPQVCGPSFYSASIIAGNAGGLPAIFAGTFIGGAFESIFSRLLIRLRAFFPPEVTGTVVAMVGITIIPVSMMRFLGIDAPGGSIQFRHFFVGFLTLAVIVGINVWGKGKLRLYSILVGMTTGYASYFFLGLFPKADLHKLAEASMVSLPMPELFSWSISWALVVPFIIASLCSSLKTVGDLTTCQKINDEEWKRPEMKSIGGGVLADALGAMSAGILGGMGQSTSTSNIGLSIATGATSRRIAWATGIILGLLAFFPKVATVFAIMPSPVMGAALVFCVSFMILAGIQIIMSRMIDARKTLVVGISIILGLSVDTLPGAYSGVPIWLKPLFGSSLALATVSAVVLNLIFRIGIAQKKPLFLHPGVDSSDTIFRFMDKQGRAWGARPEVIVRATRVISEFFESNELTNLAKGEIRVDVSFDEFNLDVYIQYEGQAMEFPTSPPSAAEVVEDEIALARLSAILIRRSADRIHCEEKNGRCSLHFHYEH